MVPKVIPPQNVSETYYRREVAKRREWCRQLVTGQPYTVAMVCLSCKRPTEMTRLLKSLYALADMQAGQIEQRVLVDNGSGEAVLGLQGIHYHFNTIIAHPANIGMGAAINDALAKLNPPPGYVLFIEDDLVYDYWGDGWIPKALSIFEFPEIGLIKLKRKEAWDAKPYRRIGPMQTTSTGVRFHPWLPSPRWTFRWGQRPWYPVGIHNVWSLGPVMFRWVAWKEAGPILSGQGRGQAVAAEEVYARRFNLRWLAARPVDFAPFSQPPAPESPGFGDRI